jgi:hypothetical protein
MGYLSGLFFGPDRTEKHEDGTVTEHFDEEGTHITREKNGDVREWNRAESRGFWSDKKVQVTYNANGEEINIQDRD